MVSSIQYFGLVVMKKLEVNESNRSIGWKFSMVFRSIESRQKSKLRQKCNMQEGKVTKTMNLHFRFLFTEQKYFFYLGQEGGQSHNLGNSDSCRYLWASIVHNFLHWSIRPSYKHLPTLFEFDLSIMYYLPNAANYVNYTLYLATI